MSLLLILPADAPATDNPETRNLLVAEFFDEPEFFDDVPVQVFEDSVEAMFGVIAEIEHEVELADDFIAQLLEDGSEPLLSLSLEDVEAEIELPDEFFAQLLEDLLEALLLPFAEFDEPADELEDPVPQRVEDVVAPIVDTPEARMEIHEDAIEMEDAIFQDGQVVPQNTDEPIVRQVVEWLARARRRGVR